MNVMFSVIVGLAIVYCFSSNYETEGFIKRQDKPMSTEVYEIKKRNKEKK